MRVAILTAMNKRHSVSKIYCEYIRKFIDAAPCEVIQFAVISESESESICIDNNINFVYSPNKPLGRKWNNGLQLALNHSWDYLMIMGDDDIISPQAWKHYLPLMESRTDYFGFTKIYFHEVSTGKTYFHDIRKKGNPKNHLVGCGRMISRTAINKLPHSLWKDDANMTLDFYSERNLILNLKVNPVQIDECLMVDLKTDFNIWNMNSYKPRCIECSSDLLIPILGQKPEFVI